MHTGLSIEIVEISTKGDRDKTTPLEQLGAGGPGKAIFAHELQRALLDGEIDIAVHSLKDLTGAEPEGLVIASVPERADPRDVLVSRDGLVFSELEPGSVIGTSSVRREALVRAARPDLVIAPLRGNVDTRLRKVADGEVDAAVLAGAGLLRLQRDDEIVEWLDPYEFVPPPGQGAIAIEARIDRFAADLAWLVSSEDTRARVCVDAERELMRLVEGTCDVPLGAWARHEDDVILMDGFLVRDGVSRGQARGDDPIAVAASLAAVLL